jgi:hypothetical protein
VTGDQARGQRSGSDRPASQAAAQAPGQVRELAAQRAAARATSAFATADQLRAQIAELGWTVTDTPGGYELAPAARTGPVVAAGDYQVLPNPAAVPSARSVDDRRATVALLVEGWPADLRECVSALIAHAPDGVMISALDVGNRDGAGDVLQELAAAHPGRIEAWHVAGSAGWSAARNALLRSDPGPAHVIMETSTILTGDAITPLLAALAADDVVAAGWRGADPDPDLRAFHEAGPGQVTALLGYLLAVRTEAAGQAGGLFAGARFYRNADLEFSLRIGRLGRLVVPDEPLPVRQARHRGYHDTDPEYRDRESRRNYRRVLELLRGGQSA